MTLPAPSASPDFRRRLERQQGFVPRVFDEQCRGFPSRRRGFWGPRGCPCELIRCPPQKPCSDRKKVLIGACRSFAPFLCGVIGLLIEESRGRGFCIGRNQERLAE